VSSSSRAFERTGGQVVHHGRIIDVVRDTFRFADGTEVERDIVRHAGAVAVVAVDDEAGVVYLVRQPREAVDEPALLELPAGTLDVENETPLECAQRELAEEVGMAAGDWQELRSFYLTPGYSTEKAHLFLATELYDASSEPDDDERIEIVKVPLSELETTTARCKDAASIIGLMLLRDLL
jgi:ADP-ribose pyrophosphatase